MPWVRRRPDSFTADKHRQNSHRSLARFRNPVAVATMLATLLLSAPPSVSDDAKRSLRDELPRIAGKTTNEAATTFHCQAGFTMQLVASEPLTVDPIAGAFDEDGRLYVVEMRDYPFNKPGQPPLGQIRRIEDKDGDGRYETSVLFAEGFYWPTGVAVGLGGVFVAAAPDIWFLRDTDGDGRADERRKVFTGFQKQNVQGLVNGLIWGLDHMIYGASASNGGVLRAAEGKTARAVSVSGSDFRFNPRSLAFEAISGSAQYGNTFDDEGRRYICSNSDHAQQVVLPSEYLARNPYLPVPRVVRSIAAEGGAGPVFRISQPEPWRVVRTRRRAASGDPRYPPSELVVTGYFTSASGITVYRGSAYPPSMKGDLFIGDVGGNLIHRKKLVPDGVLRKAVRADQGVEFLASTDNWFRPVNFINAPDGTLFVFDMCRETIEHPASIPDDIKEHVDLESGRDRGRVYRLAPPDFKVPAIPKMSKSGGGELVSLLEHPNLWHRETAHRLIWERQDRSLVGAIRRLLVESRSPLGRLHALWSLEGLDAIQPDDLARGLADAAPVVRRAALKLAEPRFTQDPALLATAAKLAGDPDIEVRAQAAFSLGSAPSGAAVEPLAKIAERDAADQWVRVAVLSSATQLAEPLYERLRSSATFARSKDGKAWLDALANLVGAAKNPESVARLLDRLADPASGDRTTRLAAAANLAEGARGAKTSIEKLAIAPAAHQAADRLFAEAASAIDDSSANAEEKTAAARLLGFAPLEVALAPLKSALVPRQPIETQRAAVRSLTRFTAPQVATALLADFRQLSPSLQAEIVDALLSRREWSHAFLDAVERKEAPASLAAPARIESLSKGDPRFAERAKAILGATSNAARGEVIAKYLPGLARPANLERGRVAFERECLNCHRLGKKGHDVGPNLATVRNRTPDNLLTHILDPNREVLPTYVEYTAVLDDGRVVSGVVAGESANSITLRKAQGVEEVILRTNLEQLAASGRSIMPEGLEMKVTPEEMNDLIAYVLKADLETK